MSDTKQEELKILQNYRDEMKEIEKVAKGQIEDITDVAEYIKKLQEQVKSLKVIQQEYAKLDKINTQEIEELKEENVKAKKWDKLVEAIKESNGDEDSGFDIWDYLADEGVSLTDEKTDSESDSDSDSDSEDEDEEYKEKFIKTWNVMGFRSLEKRDEFCKKYKITLAQFDERYKKTNITILNKPINKEEELEQLLQEKAAQELIKVETNKNNNGETDNSE